MTNDQEYRTLFRGTAESNVQANAENTRTTSDLIPNTRLQKAHCEQMLKKQPCNQIALLSRPYNELYKTLISTNRTTQKHHTHKKEQKKTQTNKKNKLNQQT